jgi:hypothetical protein
MYPRIPPRPRMDSIATESSGCSLVLLPLTCNRFPRPLQTPQFIHVRLWNTSRASSSLHPRTQGTSFAGIEAWRPLLLPSIVYISHPSRRRLSRTCPATGDVDPLRHAGAVLAFDVDDVGVASASAAHAVLLGRVPVLPVVVLFLALLLVQGGEFQEGRPRELARAGGVRGTVLDRGVSVAEVTEVVDIARGEEGSGGQGMDWCVSPLFKSAFV